MNNLKQEMEFYLCRYENGEGNISDGEMQNAIADIIRYLLGQHEEIEPVTTEPGKRFFVIKSCSSCPRYREYNYKHAGIYEGYCDNPFGLDGSIGALDINDASEIPYWCALPRLSNMYKPKEVKLHV